MKGHKVTTKSVAVPSWSRHNAHETHSVLTAVLLEQIVSGAGLAMRTTSDVRGVGK